MNKILISSLIGLLVLIVMPEKRHFPEIKPSNLLLPLLSLLISVSLSFAVISIDNSADWRKIAAAIAQRAKPEDLVLVYQSHGASLLKRYYKGNLEFKGVTHDFEEEIKQRELQIYNGSTHYRPFFSQDVLGRLDHLIDGRKRFFVVFFPISNNEVVFVRDFMLSSYIVNEIIMVKQAQILLLSSKS